MTLPQGRAQAIGEGVEISAQLAMVKGGALVFVHKLNRVF
jgi:hypothetical protein